MRPPLPPFSDDSATEKVRLAENAWNSKEPVTVANAYTFDCEWRNRAEFVTGRAQIVSFLTRKWNRELDYKLVKELWAYKENRIAVRFAYEYRNDSNQWFRAYGNENWQFNAEGLMEKRIASINEHPISADSRRLIWEGATRPDDFPNLTELEL
jgi:nuclear transport factor 2 (NTF2) superfamily protein